MNRRIIATILVAVLIISAAVFVVFYQPGPDVTDDEITPGDDNLDPVGDLSFHDAVNSFAFDFYRKIYDANDGNVFVSPYSIFTALAMTYEGANGSTAEEMAGVLNVEQDNESFHSYMKNLYDVLNNQNEDYDLSTANALWVQQQFNLLPAYLNVIQTYYGGDATEVDYNNPAEAAGIINQWVEDQTNGLIKDLITEDLIDPLTRLILTNAIYFKGVWQTQFDPVNTTNRSFTTVDESSVLVETMALVGSYDLFSYTETDNVQILELSYTGDDISMVIILPKETSDLSAVIETLAQEQYTLWLNAMVKQEVDILLPKFKVETKYQLKQNLRSMGMNIPFLGSADFSGITGGKDLYIDEVVHKAYIDVNEEGTEAAAATGVVMRLTSVQDEPSRAVFDCDHPFLYLIRHKKTETILFIGTISDPSA